MPSASKVAAEALVVGAVFAVFFALVHAADMASRGQAAMTHPSLGGQTFVAAALGHVLFEVTGLNRYYANNYE